MKTIGIFYGSTTGNTESAAKAIASRLDVDDVRDIGGAPVSDVASYDVILLGTSTWGIGDLQDDWESVIDDLSSLDLSGKQVAVFGTGDSASYPDSFCDAVATLAEAAESAGATLVGNDVDPSGYAYEDSRALRDGKFCGLLLDEDNEPGQTPDRIAQWVEQIKSQCGL